MKDLGIMLDSKLHFHHHVNYLHSQAVMLSRLIPFTTYNFWTFFIFLMFYNFMSFIPYFWIFLIISCNIWIV
jgi:hypothetical protein